jgi:hypothetical protein
MSDAAGAPAGPRVSRLALAGLAAATLVVFYLGVLPARLLELAAASVGTIL